MAGAASACRGARIGARLGVALIALVLGVRAEAARRFEPSSSRLPSNAESARAAVQPGREQVGKASIYSRWFDGRKMADGKRFNPNADVAASKTLPLGTVAKVTNLDNGKSTEVRVEDRGPHVRGRVLDLAPAAARKVGLTNKQGVVPVAVKPIAVPRPGPA